MNPPHPKGVKCLCCKAFFYPSANNRGRQLFCLETPCRKAAKARANRKWRDKNPTYDSGPAQVERVRNWRLKNPGYSLVNRPKTPRRPLQDFATSQVSAEQLFSNKNLKPQSVILQSDSGPVPGAKSSENPLLQDFAKIQAPLLYGLIASIMGDALQDSFGSFASMLVERGRRVMAASPGGAAA